MCPHLRRARERKGGLTGLAQLLVVGVNLPEQVLSSMLPILCVQLRHVHSSQPHGGGGGADDRPRWAVLLLLSALSPWRTDAPGLQTPWMRRVHLEAAFLMNDKQASSHAPLICAADFLMNTVSKTFTACSRCFRCNNELKPRLIRTLESTYHYVFTAECVN